jgi:hypothetical protein
MRRVLNSVTRGVCVVAVVVTLNVTAAYAAPRDRDGDGVRERIVRVIRHLISIVSGDGISDPKPTDPPPTP